VTGRVSPKQQPVLRVCSDGFQDTVVGDLKILMQITVIICTRSRSQRLRRTLDSLLTAHNLKADDWNMLVVDNASTDDTQRVCREFERRFPLHFRLVAQQKPGKSNALNTAIAAAQGDVLAFTDDDVFCDPGYLGSIRALFDQESVDAAQGRILLECEDGWPAWLDQGLALSFGHRDCGSEVSDLVGTLDGCNTIVRAEVFRRIGGFCPQLGPGAIGLGEDTEFSLRMRRYGLRQVYAPDIVVRHQLSKRRVTKSALRKRFFQNGRATAYYEGLPVSLPRFALYLMKESLSKELAAAWHSCRGRVGQALRCQCELHQQAGLFWQHHRFSVGVPRQLSTDLPLPVANENAFFTGTDANASASRPTGQADSKYVTAQRQNPSPPLGRSV
jgi:glucosyl-dolichyl phosphate glucuronosyltransferase